ncbi:CaiB/BaiF CoA-transferase family protein [Rhizobium sp. ICMP 5592]|uniref:CaiB/BaiF CoA transferase family protein n=1 Tax=Rhizobium sp. ICMP 5592 TaxID=2292445 RepID=UPI001296579F|nr:CaiB/BaiF CoA-transferase family protein [Rhizobium sp. ICMP 5592]MQB41314.1 CoA transferase [Rhizobium sp. ICMP 5592]
MNSLPLDGIRVIDFTQVMLGPSCTQVLADYGAEVIKIEKVRIGDLSRWSLGSDPDGLNNPVFCSLNRNKKSLALDLKQPEACDAVLTLLKTADVVVNNFRPGVMERMGFGFEDLKKINKRLIYAVGTGFGLTGPYQHKGGQDVLAQAVSGVMRRKSDNSHPTSIYATPLADYSAGMHLVQGILLALLQRDKTGEGQQVAVSLYNSMLAMQMQEGTTHLMRQRDLNWGAFPLTGVFETTDGAIVMVGAFKQNPLQDICNALEIEDLSQYPHYKDFDAQMARRPELQAIFRDNFAKNTTAHWLERLEGVDILCAPVRSLPEALKDEQTIINKMILEAGETPAGPIRLIGSPIDMSAAHVAVRIPPPQLGQHNDEILGSLGRLQGDAA